MARSSSLRAQDVRFLHQLVGECLDLGDDPLAWREHWFAQLGRRVAADLVIGGETSLRGGKPLSLGTADWGWANGPNRPVWLDRMAELATTLESDLSGALVIASYFQRITPNETGRCLGRSDMIADRDWYRSRYFAHIHEPVGVDHIIVCFHQPPGMSNDFDGLVLSRLKTTKAEFSRREQKIVEEAHALLKPRVGSQLARFHDPSPYALPPRCRQVLNCLLEGDSDKQIAKRLQISSFTVNQYTKTILRHFHVKSRTELLALWIRRLHKQPFPWAQVNPPPSNSR